MKAMVEHRSHVSGSKRQIAQVYPAGETLHGHAEQHDLSLYLIRIWVTKFEAGNSVTMPRSWGSAGL
jgi:hypothetical protein